MHQKAYIPCQKEIGHEHQEAKRTKSHKETSFIMARIEGEGKLHSQPTTIAPSLHIINYISPFSLTLIFTSAAKSV
jgi:hypothetical protein